MLLLLLLLLRRSEREASPVLFLVAPPGVHTAGGAISLFRVVTGEAPRGEGRTAGRAGEEPGILPPPPPPWGRRSLLLLPPRLRLLLLVRPVRPVATPLTRLMPPLLLLAVVRS